MSAKVLPTVSRLLQEYILPPRKVPSGIGINDIDLSTPLTSYESGRNPKIRLNIPILSAAMQSVTGPEMMKAMATEGGLGVVYRSQEPEDEAAMVRKVKEYKAGFVVPNVFSPEATIADVDARIRERGYSTFPITDNGEPNGKLVGYITRKDFYLPRHRELKVKDRMLPVEKISLAMLADVLEDGVPSLKKANDMLVDSHHGSLPIVDERGMLKYVVFKKDAESKLSNPHELLDKKRRLMCGAALDTHDYKERSKLLADAEADLFVVDASQAMSDYMEETVRYLKDNYDTPVVAGNIVTPDGFKLLEKAGADGVKIGMGSGYICTTQDQKRVGRGQATAVAEVAAARNALYKKEKVYIPLISDGGVMNFGDITIALALGADAVMVGRLVAGTDESPTDVVAIKTDEGEQRVKPYWGEGSRRAWAWAPGRYEQNIFEEGFETVVSYVGPLKPYLPDGLARVKAGLRDVGCRNIRELHNGVLNKDVKLDLMSSVMRSEIETKAKRAINVALAFRAASS